MSDKIKIVYINHVDQSYATLTASTEAPFYPVENIQDPRTTKKWRATSTSGNVVFNFGSAKDVDTIIVRGDAFTGREFTSTLTIEAHTSDSWGTPAFSTTLTFSDTHNIGIKILDTVQSYRYWRIVGSNSSSFGLSNVCLGESFIPARNITTNFDFEERDLSRSAMNDNGQKFFIQENRKSFCGFDFKFLTKEQIDEFMTMFDEVGKTKPIWVIPDNAEFFSPEKERFAGQFYLTKVPTYKHSIKGLYNISFDLEEVI